MVIILIYLLAQHRVKHSVVDTRNDADDAAVVATAAAVADVVADEWLLTYAVEALSYVVYLVLASAPVSGWVVAVVAAVARVSGVSVESAVVSSSVVAGDICPQPPWTYFSHIPWSSPDIRYGCFYGLKQFHIWPKIKRQRLLPPANEVCEGYVFTGVCLSTWGGGVRGFIWWGAWMVLFGGHAWFRGRTPILHKKTAK